jgi:hypothetical protein
VLNEVVWIKDSLPKLHAKKLKINQHLVKDSIHNEIYSIIDYLDDHHGFNSIAPIFNQNLDSLITIARGDKRYFDEAGTYMESLGLQKYRIYKNSWNSNNEFRFATRSLDYTDISGYDELIKSHYYNRKSTPQRFYVKGFTYCTEQIDAFEKIMTIHTKKEEISIDLNPLSNRLLKEFGENSHNDLNRKKLTILKNTKTVDLKIEISNIRFEKENDSLFIDGLNTTIFIKEK